MNVYDWVRVTSGFREGREGCVMRIEDWPGGEGLHALIRFPNEAEHWQHVSTITFVDAAEKESTDR